MKNSIVPKGPQQLGFLDRLDNEGKQWLAKWSTGWTADIAQARGEQWGDPKSSPMFLANYISNLLLKKQALLTESKPILDVLVKSPGLYETSVVLKKTMDGLWDELKVQIALEQSAAFLETLGHFFWRIFWDPTANFGLGDIAITAIDPRLMRLDPGITHVYDLQEGQYIIEDEIVPYGWVCKHFPKVASNVEPNVNLSILGNDQAQKGFFKRWLYKRSADIADSAMPRVWIRRYWITDPALDDDDKPMFPGGRLIIRTGDDVILNPSEETEQQNPYFDGLWPYEMLDNRPDIDHPFGKSEVEPLKRLQEAVNRMGHTVVRSMIKNTDWVMSDANALTPDTIAALKQLEQVVIEKGAGREVTRVPATTPTQVETGFIQMVIGIMKELSGVADDPMSGAKGRVELRSQPQLQGLQEAGQLLVRFQARRLEWFFERVGQKLISRIFQFYDSDRVLNYAGPDKIKQYVFEKDLLRQQIVAQALVITNKRIEKKITEAQANGEEYDPSQNDAMGAEDILLAIKGAWAKFSMKSCPIVAFS